MVQIMMRGMERDGRGKTGSRPPEVGRAGDVLHKISPLRLGLEDSDLPFRQEGEDDELGSIDLVAISREHQNINRQREDALQELVQLQRWLAQPGQAKGGKRGLEQRLAHLRQTLAELMASEKALARRTGESMAAVLERAVGLRNPQVLEQWLQRCGAEVPEDLQMQDDGAITFTAMEGGKRQAVVVSPEHVQALLRTYGKPSIKAGSAKRTKMR